MTTLACGLAGLAAAPVVALVVAGLPERMLRAERRECALVLEQPPAPGDEPAGWLACSSCGQGIRLPWGACRRCGAALPAAAGMGAGLAVAGALVVGGTMADPWRAGLALVMTWALAAAAAIDYEHMLLPDVIVLPLLWLGLLAGVGAVFVPADLAVLGAAAGYLLCTVPRVAFRLVTGRDGMGRGDAKLLAALGAWLGPVPALAAFLGAAVIGLVAVGLAALAGRRHRTIPFGPCLALAGWGLLLVPGGAEAAWAWWMRLSW